MSNDSNDIGKLWSQIATRREPIVPQLYKGKFSLDLPPPDVFISGTLGLTEEARRDLERVSRPGYCSFIGTYNGPVIRQSPHVILTSTDCGPAVYDMTEQEWLECTDVRGMLRVLNPGNAKRLSKYSPFWNYRISERKARLFCCALCREIYRGWSEGQKVNNEYVKREHIVRCAEMYADGDRVSLEKTLIHNYLTNTIPDSAEAYTCGPKLHTGHMQIVSFRVQQQAWVNHPIGWAYQAFLLRDVLGNPFKTLTIDPSWLTRNVVGIAERVYEDRNPDGRFDEGVMAILGDALEEEGCTDNSILSHLKGNRLPNLHYRGCYVIDAILGKS